MANEPQIYIRRANLVADPETRTSQSGKQFLALRVACNTSHKDQNGNWQTDDTYYYGVTLWNMDQISFYQHLQKGDAVSVRGSYRETHGQDRDGNPTVFKNIDFAEIAYLHSPRQQNGQSQNSQNNGWAAPASNYQNNGNFNDDGVNGF